MERSGVASFLAYLGYGYFDAWHAVATLGLLLCFVVGLTRSWGTLRGLRHVRTLLQPSVRVAWSSAHGLGRACLLAVAIGMIGAGLTILAVGMTCVFVPEDLAYLGLSVEELHAFNPRLVPLIAHDRAGFGGAICSGGLAALCCIWCGTPSRSLWWILCLVGLAGFGSAIGIHPIIGYDDPVHLAPAVFGAVLYLAGLVLTYRHMVRSHT